MSTRAIREALDHMEACDTGAEMPLVRAARAEVEAIEKAARVISADATVHAIEPKDEAAVKEAENLLFDISEAMPPKT